jgi:hypothetical protein
MPWTAVAHRESLSHGMPAASDGIRAFSILSVSDGVDQQ